MRNSRDIPELRDADRFPRPMGVTQLPNTHFRGLAPEEAERIWSAVWRGYHEATPYTPEELEEMRHHHPLADADSEWYRLHAKRARELAAREYPKRRKFARPLPIQTLLVACALGMLAWWGLIEAVQWVRQ